MFVSTMPVFQQVKVLLMKQWKTGGKWWTLISLVNYYIFFADDFHRLLSTHWDIKTPGNPRFHWSSRGGGGLTPKAPPPPSATNNLHMYFPTLGACLCTQKSIDVMRKLEINHGQIIFINSLAGHNVVDFKTTR